MDNKKIIILLLIIIAILSIGLIVIMQMSQPVEVTYENYPDISKDIIDNFNKYDKNNDTFVSRMEYQNSVRGSVYNLIYPKYFSNTVDDDEAMNITDYEKAFDAEQKQIDVERAKDKAQQEHYAQVDKELYDKWYSRYGNPDLSYEENYQQFSIYTRNNMYRMVFG